MSDDDIDDGDEECFYTMLESDKEISEPTTPTDEYFYQIDEATPSGPVQPYIDEPITPSDELSPNFRYSTLTQEQYVELMMKYVDEVKDILQLPSSIVKLLLHHFKWNKERLLERFYEIEQEEFFRQAKVINPFSQKTSEIPSTRTCLICYSDDEDQDEMIAPVCQHSFCRNCWKSYIINQIVNEGQAQAIVCPDSQCEILINDELIQQILGENEFVKHIYQKIILNSYVDHNPRARWCPGQNCGHIINGTSLTSAYNYAQLITCNHCHTSFCFQCAQPWHDPIKCILLSQWTKKLLDDSLTVIWLKANTKSCPNCQVNIEKNGGCNHMTCRSCMHEFCWLCFGKWSGHSECNRYTENGEIQARHASIMARYIHYHDRFRNHEHSLDLERKLYRKTRWKLRRNPEELSKNDIRLIKRAFHVLFDCRQMLIYTYPFAYYLIKNNQSIFFEQNQADLERACEELSEILEQDLTKESIFEQMKRKLKEKYQYCQARKDVLLKHVKEGYTNGYWQYQEDVITRK